MTARAGRLPYLDWLRGLAVVLMILWHAMDAWTRPAAAQSPAFARLAFAGGWAAPLFLVLAGVSIALAGSSRTARGASRAAVAASLAKRGAGIFLIALAMRLPGLLNPRIDWRTIFTADILNVLGIGIMAVAFAWTRARTAAGALIWLAGPAVLIVMLVTPAIAIAAWPAALSPYVEAYLRHNGAYSVFSLLPWIAFIFAGAWAGTTLGVDRAPIAAGAAGLSLVALGAIGSRLPPLMPTEYWTTSISWMCVRTGVVLAALPVSAWFCRAVPRWAIAPGVVLGQTSLFVYVVHLELTYGLSAISPLTHALSVTAAAVAAAGLVVVMTVLAAVWRRFRASKRANPAAPLVRSNV